MTTVKNKKRPQVSNSEGVSPYGTKPKMTATLSKITQSSPEVNTPRKDILADTYTDELAEKLAVYPPSVLGQFFAVLIDKSALKQWDNGIIHRNIIVNLHYEIERYEISDIIGKIKRRIYLSTYIAKLVQGQVKSSGQYLVCKCPFCNTKNKMWISKNGYCNCFKCQFPKSMDLLNFYCRFYDVELDEAIHKLAQEAGL